MKYRIGILLLAWALLVTGVHAAEAPGDVFKGRLFPPNVILKHQDALELSKDQFTAIKAAVVDVQANVAGHEWDMREAYVNIMAELDKSPVDEARVLTFISAALLAENEVKKEQVTMLIRLRNLLTEEQITYLQSQHGANKGGWND